MALRGTVTALAGLFVLSVAGFGLGLAAGTLWEAPGLVVRYLTGETQEIAWATERSERRAEAPAPDLPDVAAKSAAPLPAPAKPAPKAESPARAARPKQSLPPVLGSSKAPAGPHVAVQVGAFAESGSAEGLASSLRDKGYPAYVSPTAEEGSSRWRVRVGPIGSRDEADRVAARLKREEKLPTWVISEN